jgi:4-hydroxy-3-polyprenylbenzoate decarboxylase
LAERPAAPARLVFGVSGASGARLADATAQALLRRGVALELVCSDYGELMWPQETDEQFADAVARWAELGTVSLHSATDVAAPIASGSYPVDGMAIVPCSMATVGALASGAGRNLLHRAADVALKERRPLVLVPRETPLSVIHLRNLTALAEAGAVVLPPEPAFYLRPQSVDELVEALAQRILRSLGVVDELDPPHRWR